MIKPIVLIILDGWGLAPKSAGNAISLANTPNMNALWSGFPHTQLAASGEAVGLPHGENGNTETGHLNIGAGQVVYQDLPRINISIADGSFFENPAFMDAINHAIQNKSKLHLLGLIGSGGVHSNIEHLFALMRLAKQRGLSEVYLHLITDGRDSPPSSALTYIAQVKQNISSLGIGKIATIMGRYFAMDRDQRWDRTAKAYFSLTKGSPIKNISAEEVILESYQKKIMDEFIEPTTILGDDNLPVALIGVNDSVIFMNFRIDRPRQLTKAFVLDNFEKEAGQEDFDPFAVKYFKTHIQKRTDGNVIFARGPKIQNLLFATMTRYEINLPTDVAFPPQFIQMPLGRVLSEKGLRQLRVSETEKERFVTYYFNGQRESAFNGEDRIIVPSLNIATYDLQPAMSTPQLTETVVMNLDKRIYDVIVVNVACPDMVAHTGNLNSTIVACEAADKFVGIVTKKALSLGGGALITSDHGNAEELLNSTGGADTEHSSNPVPLIVIATQFNGQPIQLPSGALADVAPTLLKLIGAEKPFTMTGRSLI